MTDMPPETPPVLAAPAPEAGAPAVSARETILVSGKAITPGAGSEAFGAVRLDSIALSPVSGRVEDALRGIGGIQLFRATSTRTSNPSADGVTTRGFSGNAASRMLVTLDGVPLNDPFFGYVAWTSLIGREIASAEVVRGGGVGGSGALAGTIAFVSDARPTHMRARVGSRASVEVEGAAGIAVSGGHMALSGGLSRGDGHKLVAEPGPADAAARYDQWGVGARHVAELGKVTLESTLSAFEDNRLRGVEGADNHASGADASLRVTHEGSWRLQGLLHGQMRAFSSVTRTLDPARAEATTVLDQEKTPASGWGLRLTAEPPLGADAALQLGAEWIAREGYTNELFRYQAGLPTRQRKAGGSQDIASLFADGSLRLGSSLLLTAAGRVDHWRLGDGMLREIDLATGLPTLDEPAADRSGTEGSGRLGLAWRPLPAIGLRAAAYTGWRLPTINELHRPFRAGLNATAANPALNPERLKGVEASLGWQPIAAIDLSVTLFANQLDDPVSNVTLGQGPGLFPGVGFVPAGGSYRQRQNLDRIRSRGVEADARVRLGATRIDASLAYVDARVRGGGLDGERPSQAPELSGSIGIGHRVGPFDGAVTFRHLGPRFEDDLNSRRLRSASTVDARLALDLGRGITLEASAENLTDARIETGFSGAQPERGQPRTLWLGLLVRPR